jgi:hypothetical protein
MHLLVTQNLKAQQQAVAMPPAEDAAVALILVSARARHEIEDGPMRVQARWLGVVGRQRPLHTSDSHNAHAFAPSKHVGVNTWDN